MKPVQLKPVCLWAVILLTLLSGGRTPSVRAADFFKTESAEKSKPELFRSDDKVVAKLIPRSKNTSISISFSVSGGYLQEVRAIDLPGPEHYPVDEKNFRSAAFDIRVDAVAPGGVAEIQLESDMFTASTSLHAMSSAMTTRWPDASATNSPAAGKVRRLLVAVQDGGPFDADGTTDGKVALIGGPWDSFWGYALGTLFIRFFGIFIVLTILMMGMFFSGFVFRRADRKARPPIPDSADSQQEGPVREGNGERGGNTPAGPVVVSEEDVAAIAVAMYRSANWSPAGGIPSEPPHENDHGDWTTTGRSRIMNERLAVFRRFNRS